MKKSSLTQQLAEAQKQAQYWEGKYDALYHEHRELKEEVKKKQEREIGSYSKALEDSNEMNRQMMEIVRWHVNPQTAERSKTNCTRCGAVNAPGVIEVINQSAKMLDATDIKI